MSTLFLADGPIPLAERLADLLDHQARADDCFAPTQIVVPNPYLGQWLRLWLARRHGIAVNLRFGFLEQLLWEMLRKVDPRPHKQMPEMLDGETYRLLVLAVLLGESASDLASLRSYFGSESPGSVPASSLPSSRRSWRRAWHLADVLGSLIRDYEYHRQETLIQPWIRKELALAGTDFAKTEKAQRAVFEHIIRLDGGKRALLSERTGRNFKTLPQYAMELMEIGSQELGVRRQETGVRSRKGGCLGPAARHSCLLTPVS